MPKVKITDIKVPHERFREDFGDIEELAVSIQRYGMLHPIVVDKDLNLIAGERRLKAHIVLGLEEIEVKYVEDTDELLKREIEIEENMKRKDFTWQEEVKAKLEIDKIKRQLYGSAIKGHGGGWSLRDTAASLGESVGLTSRDINLAEAFEEFPELMKEKSKDAAWRKLQKLREVYIPDALTEKVVVRKETKCLVHGDSTVEMKKLESGSVDLVLTDPPFGIELQMKGDTYVFNVVDMVVVECYRVLKEGRHMYIFHDPRHYETMRRICESKGFKVLETPLIWYKKGGAGPVGSELQWVHNYECILFCYKGHRRLNRQGESDVLEYPRLPQLLRYLIEMSTEPGELVIDPFAGSGSTLIAAWEMKRQAWGCELNRECHSSALLKLEDYIRNSSTRHIDFSIVDRRLDNLHS